MRLICTLGLMVCCSPVGAQESRRFEGTWKMLMGSKQGTAVADDKLKEMSVVFKDGIMTVRDGEKTSSAKYQVDSAAKTIHFEADKDNKACDGIYQFNAVTLKLVWALPGRPKLIAMPEKPDANLNVFVLQRAKE